MENTISVPPKKKNAWFGKIETKEEALKVIKDASMGASAIISRVVAIIFLLLSIAVTVYTRKNKFGGGTGGKNIILAVIMIWTSIRAIQATFGLRKFQQV